APIHVVIVPIHKTDEQLEQIGDVANNLISEFKKRGISYKYDDRTTHRPGAKFVQYELQGVPLRIAIGPKDLENKTVELARRDTLSKENVSLDGLVDKIDDLLVEIQDTLFKKALDFRNSHITEVDNFEDFKAVLETKTGFISAHWDGTAETEDKIKDLTKATIRCVPLDQKKEVGSCVFTGKTSKGRVLFAKAY